LKLLLDEMFTGLKDYLEVIGWDVMTVHEAGIKGSGDRGVVEYAHKNGLLLVTEDRKPAELAEMLGVKNVYISNADIARVADVGIREKYPGLFPGSD
jgi:predicted nuclease of predicted toxin-antitoxin system